MKESIFTNKCEKFSVVSIMVLCFFGATYTAKFLVISETSILELLFFFHRYLFWVDTALTEMHCLYLLFPLVTLYTPL